jgi:thiol-disulfide isomerase/thioredoxin
MKTIAALILGGLLIATPALALPAPKVSIASFAQLTPPEAPYDVAANASAAVDAAFARARRNHKRVLIDLGGNWCGDCRILAGVMELPEMRRFLRAHFEIVSIDVGRFDTNLQIPARFGFTKRLLGVPTVLIATPQGALVNGGDVFALSDARHMQPQAVADWLAKWAK